MKSTFLSSRFFLACGAIILVLALGFAIPVLFPIGQFLLFLFIALVLADWMLLFQPSLVLSGTRRLPRMLSLGDENPIYLDLVNSSNLSLRVSIIDELPEQLQVRDFKQKISLRGGEFLSIRYDLRPLERGEYSFGATNCFVSALFGLVERRIQLNEKPMRVAVYPSIIQMKQLEMRALDRITTREGIKKIRRIGHSYEFEQIKNYVAGDDFRSINWKASSRKEGLMVNQFEDERAQQVYCIIDKSRVMRMPFKGLSLMDYAINATLAISNIIIKKYDKAGLITYSDKIGTTIKADNRPTQLNFILNALYKEKERPLEANYELLFHISSKLINGRSLILLFTNFESAFALDRALPILRRINRRHLLVVVFFDNTEIREFAEQDAVDLESIYQQTMARKYLSEKAQMVLTLRQYGIQAVLTRPEDLSINTINKYLELKARGLI
ncbi:DUF58 domain-containing protein [Haliscomenobacter hydrossis]|uniref:DUF58 domain-containing protein n=1 Tax=Haliscomenobacter hydrossis (strain ATCC 27775 / DSM 1100 / LMG 10767 / O) TaxID=760192 RepID=F4KXM6_HALH1|nr:DUF58 domain-containing protein [Haliscomenobacter hydrossis]AEE51387.1 protein of unknown function DUF58 [Haliscomenobacter hydrossis DSM 1100]